MGITALIPARKGSSRVPGKNLAPLNGHPILAYSISSALQFGDFQSIVVASDDEDALQIGAHYGADKCFLRNSMDAQATSLDIEWLSNVYRAGLIPTEFFAILRPTSPFRSAELIRRSFSLLKDSGYDSLRTVKLVSEHPGKMWRRSEDGTIIPFMEQSETLPRTHAMQYPSLPKLYVQTSVLEIAKTEVIVKTKSREGNTIIGMVTTGIDSLSIDDEFDLILARAIAERDPSSLPAVNESSKQIGLGKYK